MSRLKDGEHALKRALDKRQNQNRAKNVVLLMGDGMGIQSLTTGRILRGQKQGKSGEDYRTAMERFDNVGLSKTYNIDFQIPDSAATATARASNEFYSCSVLHRSKKQVAK